MSLIEFRIQSELKIKEIIESMLSKFDFVIHCNGKSRKLNRDELKRKNKPFKILKLRKEKN